jgi:hypothetical protein
MFTHAPVPKPDARTEYRTQESERVEHSETLAQKFPNLNSLKGSLAHFRPEGFVQMGSLKLTFNVDHAKSLVRFDCPNAECVGGDFDVSAQLAQAIAARRKIVTGEVICQGWRSKTDIGVAHCHHILRYKLSLGYRSPAIKSVAQTS